MQVHLLFVKATSLDDHYPRYCVLSHIQNLHLELLIYTNKENIFVKERSQIPNPLAFPNINSTNHQLNR
jgi:hypothetical protein